MRVLFGVLLLALSAFAVSVSAQTVINADSTNTFHIINGDGTSWFFTANGQQPTNPNLNMTLGTTYWISIEFASSAHPFGFNTASGTPTVVESGLVNVNNTCGGSVAGYTATGSGAGQKCVLAFTPNATTPTNLWYHCAIHPSMKGQILLNATGTATTAPTGTGTGTGTGTPTNSSGTTSTPTPTGSTPTTHSSASALVPAVAAVFAAVAVAGFAAAF